MVNPDATPKKTSVNSDGKVIGDELYSPFTYLRQLVDEFFDPKQILCGSEQVLHGSQNLSLTQICEPLDDIERFLASLRLEQRHKLDELSVL